MLRITLHALAFLVLTLLTQIGGIAYLAMLLTARAPFPRRVPMRLVTFLLFYTGLSIATAFVAPALGRVPLSCLADRTDRLVVRSPLYCALNRQYVTPRLRALANALSEHMDRAFPGTVTVALDANFPFIDGFPLLPHLSHTDGRKLDFAFFYADDGGRFLNETTRSPIGYFAFEQPAAGDEQPCLGRNDWLTARWDFDFLQPLFPAYRLEAERTASAIRWLTTDGVDEFGLRKVFIEPHLKKTLGIDDDHVRFQGCRAARHDDHFHVEIK